MALQKQRSLFAWLPVSVRGIFCRSSGSPFGGSFVFSSPMVECGLDRRAQAQSKKIRSRLCARENKTKKQCEIQRARPASQLFSAMPLLEAVKVLVSIMMFVSLSNKGKTIRLPAEYRQKCYRDSGQMVPSHILEFGCPNRTCGESGSFLRRKHNAALFHNPNQDVRVAVHGDDFVFVR